MPASKSEKKLGLNYRSSHNGAVMNRRYRNTVHENDNDEGELLSNPLFDDSVDLMVVNLTKNFDGREVKPN